MRVGLMDEPTFQEEPRVPDVLSCLPVKLTKFGCKDV